MEIELLGQLLGLSNCSVKKYTIQGKEIILNIERKGFPICPECGRKYIGAPKDGRVQTSV